MLIKKSKIIASAIAKRVISLLLFFLMFFIILLIRSFAWLYRVFGEISFSSVVYQLMSPMKGTSSGILWSYIFSSVILSLAILALIFIAYKVIFSLLEKRNNVYAKTYRTLYAGAFVLICAFLLKKAIVRAGMPDYIGEMTDVSYLFEEDYINPNDVQIFFPDHKRNLVLIYLESMESTYGAMEGGNGGRVNYIPELTQLAMENVYFSNSDGLGGAGVYGDTGWTMAALLASSTGVPYKLGIDGNDAGLYEKFLPGITGLGDLLKQEGYTNYFMCGSDAIYGGRSEFLSQHGDYVIYDYNTAIADELIAPDYYEFWGIEDKKLYEFAQDKLTDISVASEPFNFTLLTVDTHHPHGYVCELCDDDYPEQYGNVISCASRQAYDFVLWMQEQEWYKDTVIVLIGDHLSMNMDFFENVQSTDRKVYNCFINAAQSEADVKTHNRDFSTMDMFPTIVASLGATIEGERLGLGTNLFSDKETLPEQLINFNAELKKYSIYYTQNFITVDEDFTSWLIKFIGEIKGYDYIKTWYPRDEEIWKEGFGKREGKKIWMVGDESVIEIPLEKELTAHDLEIDMSFVVRGPQQRIEISADDEVVFEDILQKDETEISFHVPCDLINGNIVRLHISHPDATSPKELGDGPDERKLSLCVYKICLKQ